MFYQNKITAKGDKTLFPPRGNQAGFTFIELMIALVLLTVVLTLLFSSFFQISNSSQQLSAQLSDQQELRLLIKLIGDDLMGAQYFTHFAENPEVNSGIKADTISLKGEDFSEISFHAIVPTRFYRQVEQEADPGMHELAYWVEASKNDPDNLVLKRREDFYLDEDMENGGVTATLTDKIEMFLVEFMPVGDKISESDYDWDDRWDSQDRSPNSRMPLAIRFTIARAGEGGLIKETLEINLQSGLKVGG